MRNLTDDTSATVSARRKNRGLHELIMQPFPSCMDDDTDGEADPHALSFCEKDTLINPPPSQTPTVAGSVSDQSLDDDDSGAILRPENPNIFEVQQDQSSTCESSLGSDAEVTTYIICYGCDAEEDGKKEGPSFLLFRMSYLFVTLVVMLADGLQGKNPVYCEG